MITSVIKYFFGSTPGDFEPDTKNHPFKPCPDSPNCTIHVVEYPLNEKELFNIVQSVLQELSPFELKENSQSLQINAVFRIRVFGFKDDVKIIIQPADSAKSMLHIKSASRVGRSDLGVNRRRIKQILSAVNKQLK